MASQSFSLFMVIMLLLHHPLAAANWQGTGSFQSSNITEIWAYIHSNLKRNVDANTLQAFCTGLSEDLNGKWDPAWNVLLTQYVFSKPALNDVVLYGYSFKNHWLWYNGYSDPLINFHSFSFVIWKDYNCQNWKVIGSTQSGFSSQQKTFLETLLSPITYNQISGDLWNTAKILLDAVQSSSDFVVSDNHAYTVVLQQSVSSTQAFGRVCVVANGYYYSGLDYSKSHLVQVSTIQNYGVFHLFQTR